MDFPSVGATENIILASIYAEGETTIMNAAMEPEIIDLANCLNKMGARIIGAGTNNIRIMGVKRLNSIRYTIMPDRIEAGTFLCMAAATGSRIKIKNVNPGHLVPVIEKLEESGCSFIKEKNAIEIISPRRLKSIEIKTMPYPGFPTDLQSIFGAMLCTAKGTSVVVENIFENRFKYLAELKRMGAKVTVEGKTAVIKGVRKLSNATVESCDLRGGAALVLVALCCRGKTRIRNIQYIMRGYENIEKKLTKLGATIVLEEGE